MKAWQTDSKPNCNTMHEISMLSSSSNTTFPIEDTSVTMLGKPGWFRAAWKVDFNSSIHGDEGVETLVLKNLRFILFFIDFMNLIKMNFFSRYEREFLAEYFHLH